MSEYVQSQVVDKVATIRLNRPEKLNAFTDDMITSWVGLREEYRTSADVNTDPTDFAIDHLDLAGVEPGTDLQTERSNRADDRSRAPHAARWAVERSEEPVPRRVDFDPSVAPDQSANRFVMTGEQLPPRLVT